MLRLLGEFEEAEQRVEELQIEHHVKTSVGYRYKAGHCESAFFPHFLANLI